VTGYIPRWFVRLQTVTHPNTNPAMYSRESNSQSHNIQLSPMPYPLHSSHPS